MNKQGYTQIVATICEQSIPPKLIDKFLRVQTRLIKAQLDDGDDQRANPTKKQRHKQTKELTFVLPALTGVSFFRIVLSFAYSFLIGSILAASSSCEPLRVQCGRLH